MSSGAKMSLAEAVSISNRWIEALTPFCHRIAVAGSVRRERPEVGDIEICAVPDPSQAFALMNLINAPKVAALLDRVQLDERKRVRQSEMMAWDKSKAHEIATNTGRPVRVKGGWPGHQVQLALPEGTYLDLFMPDPPAWGLVYTIRTGSAEFSAALASYSKRQGFMWHEGRVYTRGPGGKPMGSPFTLPEEQDAFEFFGVRWVPPEQRTDAEALRKAARVCAD